MKHTQIMGILNVTPDSFSDGGKYNDVERAVNRAHEMIQEGAHIIDIGGISTRPGFTEISVEEELDRVIPVVSALKDCGALLSVDTYRSEVAEAALQNGAHMINDQWAGKYDENMFEVVKKYDAQMILMHNGKEALKDPAVNNMVEDLLKQAALAEGFGIPQNHIWLDPGIGFQKTREQEIEIMKNLNELTETGYKVLLATSRKRMVASLLNDDASAGERDEGTLATTAVGINHGVDAVRVHNVAMHHKFIKVMDALKG